MISRTTGEQHWLSSGTSVRVLVGAVGMNPMMAYIDKHRWDSAIVSWIDDYRCERPMIMSRATSEDVLRAQVRERYAAIAKVVISGQELDSGADAALCCGDSGGCCGPTDLQEVDDTFGSALYSAGDRASLPIAALAASLGCGNPTAVADLRAGERVLDLGSGGGIDVLLSARRVGPSGFAYGLDMTEEMLDLARANAAKARATNVHFLKGTIENIPLPDRSVDVVISNCVINLSVDKPKVLAEMFRVLTPGGRIGISDVVAEDHLSPADRAARGSYVGCVAGALSKAEYLKGLAAAGFVDITVRFTHKAADGMHSAIIQATKPIKGRMTSEPKKP
jgi:arsenite methyltransferase